MQRRKFLIFLTSLIMLVSSFTWGVTPVGAQAPMSGNGGAAPDTTNMTRITPAERQAAALRAAAPGVVTAINITSGGSGYTTIPTFAITGGGGANATATALGEVNAITLMAGGTGATANASGIVSGLAVTAGGTGYTLPRLSLSRVVALATTALF